MVGTSLMLAIMPRNLALPTLSASQIPTATPLLETPVCSAPFKFRLKKLFLPKEVGSGSCRNALFCDHELQGKYTACSV